MKQTVKVAPGISAHFYDTETEGEEPSTTEYFGRIQNIVQLHFTSCTVTLLKGLWYDSKSIRRSAPNMIIDECGFPRVRTRTYLPSHLVCHEPFVYPHECDQVFFVEDQINPGWSLVKKVDPRSKPVVY